MTSIVRSLVTVVQIKRPRQEQKHNQSVIAVKKRCILRKMEYGGKNIKILN